MLLRHHNGMVLGMELVTFSHYRISGSGGGYQKSTEVSIWDHQGASLADMILQTCI